MAVSWYATGREFSTTLCRDIESNVVVILLNIMFLHQLEDFS